MAECKEREARVCDVYGCRRRAMENISFVRVCEVHYDRWDDLLRCDVCEALDDRQNVSEVQFQDEIVRVCRRCFEAGLKR